MTNSNKITLELDETSCALLQDALELYLEVNKFILNTDTLSRESEGKLIELRKVLQKED